jgi:very-short-patch-repair endonuclease
MNSAELTRALFATKGRKITVSQESTFAFQCRALKLPSVIPHYRFAQDKHPGDKRRVWIADFAFLEWRLMVEIDGGIWMPKGGAHSHPIDITRNMTKQNDAALLGFFTLRYTPAEVKSGQAIGFTQKVLHARGWRGVQGQP